MASVPESYVAFVFDDIQLKFGNLVPARLAADKHLATMLPTDRAAIFTTSGQTVLDFTDDRAKLHDALFRIEPRPVAGDAMAECPEVSYYVADRFINKDDPQALQAAIQEAAACFSPEAAPMAAKAEAFRQLAMGRQESLIALSVLKDVVRRMFVMPGQRSMVVVSPGFLTPEPDMLQAVVGGSLGKTETQSIVRA